MYNRQIFAYIFNVYQELEMKNDVKFICFESA